MYVHVCVFCEKIVRNTPTWVTLVLQRLEVRRCVGTPKPTPKPRVEGISQWKDPEATSFMPVAGEKMGVFEKGFWGV